MSPPEPTRAAVRLFVYGTLKQGFPNSHLNDGLRVPGEFCSGERFPLYVVQLPNEDRAPWLVHRPGDGHPVTGQVFEVAPDALAAMDRFEEVGLPNGYVRVELDLVPLPDDGRRLRAHCYMKPETQLPRCLAREGPYPEYTLALAEGYSLRRDDA